MRRPLEVLALAVVLGIGVSGCAAGPEPDWRSLQTRADEFVETAIARTDVLGSGSFRVAADVPPPEDEEGGVVLNYATPVRVEGVSVSCFGEGAIRFGYITRTGSSWAGSDAVEVACDGVEQEVVLSEPLERVNAIRLYASLADGAGGVMAATVSGRAG